LFLFKSKKGIQTKSEDPIQRTTTAELAHLPDDPEHVEPDALIEQSDQENNHLKRKLSTRIAMKFKSVVKRMRTKLVEKEEELFSLK
jgi:hypothetical protein